MKHLLYIGNKLSTHGATATAIETLGPLLESEGYDVRYASSKQNKILRMIDMALQTMRLRKQTDYVLIDTYSTQNFWYAVIVAWICRGFRLRYIPILHGGNLPNRIKRNPRQCVRLFGNAFKNVAPSGYLFEAFRTAGFDTVFIPNPFDSNEFQYSERKTIAPKLLWVRSFAEIYNPEMALETLDLLRERYRDASLTMVGPDNGLMIQTKRLAQAKNLNVTFTGRLSKPEWAAIAKGCDIFINTSRVDNAPFSVIEAAALGMVIVSSNVGGIPHLLKDGESALLVDSGDALAMAEAVVRIIENPALGLHLADNSHALAQQSEWPAVREKWFEILK